MYTSWQHGAGVGSPTLLPADPLSKSGPYHPPLYWYPVPIGSPAGPLPGHGPMMRGPHAVMAPQFSSPVSWSAMHIPGPRPAVLPRSQSQAGLRVVPAQRGCEHGSRTGSTEPKPVPAEAEDAAATPATPREECAEPAPATARDGDAGAPAADRQPCEFFLRTGTCAYGSRCKFSHPMDKLPELRFNSLHLPLRPGEPVCSFYARHWRCSFGATCKFHHPEPPFPASQPSPFAAAAMAPVLPGPAPARVVPGPVAQSVGSYESSEGLRDEQARHMPPSPFDRNNSMLLSARSLKINARIALQAQSSSGSTVFVPTPSQCAPQPIMVFRGSNSSLQSSGMVGSSFFVSGLVGLTEEERGSLGGSLGGSLAGSRAPSRGASRTSSPASVSGTPPRTS